MPADNRLMFHICWSSTKVITWFSLMVVEALCGKSCQFMVKLLNPPLLPASVGGELHSAGQQVPVLSADLWELACRKRYKKQFSDISLQSGKGYDSRTQYNLTGIQMSAKSRHKEQIEQGVIRKSRSALIYTLMNDKVSRVYTEVPITLMTNQSQRAYRNAYEVIAEALYRVFEVMPMVAEEFSEKIGAVIENGIAEAHRELTEDLQKAKALADEAGLSINEIKSTVAREVVARVSTPQGMQYLQLLQKLDELVSVVETLWILGKIDSQSKKQLVMGWQKRLIVLAYDSRDLCIETVRRIADQQKMAQKHAENKKAIHERRMKKQKKLVPGHDSHADEEDKKGVKLDKKGAITSPAVATG